MTEVQIRTRTLQFFKDRGISRVTAESFELGRIFEMVCEDMRDTYYANLDHPNYPDGNVVLRTRILDCLDDFDIPPFSDAELDLLEQAVLEDDSESFYANLRETPEPVSTGKIIIVEGPEPDDDDFVEPSEEVWD